MVMNINIKNIFNSFFYLLDSGVTKLLYLSTVSKYNVIMLVVKIRFFILSLTTSKLMFSYKTTIEQ